MHSCRPVIRQRWRQLLSNSARFTGSFQNHDHTPPPRCPQGTNLLTCGGKNCLFLHTHTYTQQELSGWRDAKQKSLKKKRKTIWSGLFGANKSGELILITWARVPCWMRAKISRGELAAIDLLFECSILPFHASFEMVLDVCFSS